MAWTSSSRMIASGALITHQARFHQSRVVLIFVPAGGIALEVFADGYQFTLGTNNVFVIATLPDGMEVGVCPEPFRHTDLKPANDGTDRSRRRLWGRGGVYLGRGEKSFAPAGFGDHDNAMYVIWHDDKGIQFNQLQPTENGAGCPPNNAGQPSPRRSNASLRSPHGRTGISGPVCRSSQNMPPAGRGWVGGRCRGDPCDRPNWADGNRQGEYKIRPYRWRRERRWYLSRSLESTNSGISSVGLTLQSSMGSPYHFMNMAICE